MVEKDLDIRLENFLPFYPIFNEEYSDTSKEENKLFNLYKVPNSKEYDTPLNIFYRKKELLETKLDVIEKKPEHAGVLLNHQLFIARFLSPETTNNGVLLFRQVGTGKTCASIAIAELAKSMNPSLKKCLVLIKGASLKKNFIRELAFQCTQKKYIPKNFSHLTQGEKVARLNKLINKNYILDTFEIFSKKISNYSNETIIKEYSDRVIIIDEIHNIRIQRKKKKAQEIDVYKEIHRFLHLVKSCKTVLLSGTPMRDRPEEFSSVMNLILPIEQQLPVGKKFISKFFENDKLVNAEELRHAIRGRISYLRSMDANVIKMLMGKLLKDMKHLPLVEVNMHDIQLKGYLQAFKKDSAEKEELKEIDDDEEADEEKKEGLYDNSRQASLFVFPDGTYGAEGFSSKKWIVENKGNYRLTNEFVKLLTDNGKATPMKIIENISQYSSKFAEAIKEIIMSPQENCFVYSKFVSGSGAILFGEILKLFDFEKIGENRSKIKEKEKEEEIELKDTILTELERLEKLEEKEKEKKSETTLFGRRKVKPPPQASEKHTRKLVVMTSVTISDNETDKLLEILNSKEHSKDGHVIIGSQVIGEGKTLKNIRKIIILTPHWNNAETEQAIGRGIRIFSHDDLEEKDRNVKVYRMCSATKNYSKSIDFLMYKLSEDKELLSKQLERIAKEEAVDCLLNKKRNLLEKDKDFSRECEYTTCDYKCGNTRYSSIDDVKGGEVISDTFNLLYSGKSMKGVIEALKILYRKRFSYDLKELLITLPDVSQIILLQSLRYIIDKNMMMKNRYNFSCF